MRRLVFFFMMLCIIAGGQAQKRRDKGTKAKTTQVNSRKSQKTQKTQKSQKARNSQNSRNSRNSQKEQLQAQQRQLQKNIATNKTKKAELEKKVKEQLDAAFALGEDINEKRRTIKSIQHDIDSINGQLRVIEEQLQTLQDELSDYQEHYAQSVRFMHRNNKTHSKMRFIFSAKNVNQMYRRTRFVKEYATYQRAQGEVVKQKQQQVEQKQQELTRSKEEKAALLARGEREQQSLEEQQDKKQKMAAELQKQQKTVAALIKQQQQQEAAINKRIDQMVAEEIARQEARQDNDDSSEEQASSTSSSTGSSQKSQKSRKSRKSHETSHPADPDVHLSGNFASNKGRLPMPITGAYQVVRGFGSNVVDGARGVHLSSKGLYLKGQPGAQARCIFDGVVSGIFATGNSYIVMVRHGRYISVYSDLASVSVSSGQKVSINQALGKLGSENTMQFQLRNWTELLNPRKWLRR